MQRYFVEIDESNKVIFSKDDIFHISKVMRMKIGDEIEIVNNLKLYLAKIVSFNPALDVQIIEEIDRLTELNTYIRLLYCIPKGEKLDLVIQKACELGASEIVLVNSSRCVAKIDKNNKDKKIERFSKIIKEASEQSKRLKFMKLSDVIDYKDITKYDADLSLIAYEKEDPRVSSVKKIFEEKEYKTINVLIGAEGGFSEEEVDFAIKNGYKSISLGRRILRSETACFYLLSILSYYAEINYEK